MEHIPSNYSQFQDKFRRDASLFKLLASDYFQENSSDFYQALKKPYEHAFSIIEEAGVPIIASVPSMRKNNVDEVLTENDQQNLIYSKFKNIIEESFVKPLNSNNLNVIYENEFSQVIDVLTEGENDLDAEISTKYAIFESTIGKALREIILPKDTEYQVSKYINGTDERYYELFEKNIRVIKRDFDNSLDELSRILACAMAKKGAVFNEETQEDIFSKYGGLGKILRLKSKEQDYDSEDRTFNIKIDMIDRSLSKFKEVDLKSFDDSDDDEEEVDINDMINDNDGDTDNDDDINDTVPSSDDDEDQDDNPEKVTISEEEIKEAISK